MPYFLQKYAISLSRTNVSGRKFIGGSVGQPFQFPEMSDKFLIIVVRSRVEFVPESAQDGSPSEAEVFYLEDIVLVHTSQGNHPLVDDSFGSRLTDFFGRESRMVSFLGDAVEYRTEEYVVAHLLVGDDLLEGMTRCAHVSRIIVGHNRVAVAQVDTLELVLLLQVEVVVYDDTFMVFSGMRVSRRSA